MAKWPPANNMCERYPANEPKRWTIVRPWSCAARRPSDETAAALETRRSRQASLSHPLVARSLAEVFDPAKDELRVELTGGGSVAAFEFPAYGSRAAALVIDRERFERIEP